MGRLWLGAPAAAILLMCFLIPLGKILVASLQGAEGFSWEHYAESFNPERDIFLVVVLRTAIIAAVVTLGCAVLGYGTAYAAVRLPSPWGVILIGVVCLPFFSSALIRSYSWTVILGNNGPVNGLLTNLGIVDQPLTLVYNDVGVVVGMTQVLMPLMIFPLYSAMRSIDPGLVRASRSLGAEAYRSWRTVFLPLSMPGLIAGSTLVFIVALGYYTTPMLLQGPSTPMFAQRMDTLASLPGTSALLSAQSILMLLACVTLLVLFRKPLGLSDGRLEAGGTRSRQEAIGWRHSLADTLSPLAYSLGRTGDSVGRFALPVFTAISSVVALLMSIAPILVIAVVSFGNGSFLQFPPKALSTRWYNEVFTSVKWLEALQLTFGVSAAAAIVVAIAAAPAAFLVARARNRGFAAVGYAFLVSPLVVPQVVVAIALLSTLIGVGITGTPGALVLGYLVITMPMAMILLTTAFRSLDPLYERASAALGAKPHQTAWRVLLPLIGVAMFSALLFSFLTAFTDLVMAQFLGGPSAQTLERLLFRDIRESVSPEVAAVGTLMTALILIVGLIALLVHRSYAKRLRAASTP